MGILGNEAADVLAKNAAEGVPLVLYCIVLYLLPVLNPKSYDGARVLKASGCPLLVGCTNTRRRCERRGGNKINR